MDAGPSRTALATAYLRAAHGLLDEPPFLLEDGVVLDLLGPAARARILGDVPRYRSHAATALRAHVLLRSRHAEERLQAAALRGFGRYVVLGAGFDTFVLRQPGWASRLAIVEIDHPSTQAEKLRRLSEAGLSLPPNVRLLPADLEHDTLPECLGRSGLLPAVPTFFSWLGVSMYLREPAVRATLSAIAAFACRTEVVFTYLEPPSGRGSPLDLFRERLGQSVSRSGEPFLSTFTTPALLALCRECGFSDAGVLSRDEARDLYFQGRGKDLPLPASTGIAWATT